MVLQEGTLSLLLPCGPEVMWHEPAVKAKRLHREMALEQVTDHITQWCKPLAPASINRELAPYVEAPRLNRLYMAGENTPQKNIKIQTTTAALLAVQ